jgi:hypothetical protein
VTEDEKKILEDMKSFIDFSIENDMLFEWVLAGLGHDINGILNGELNKGFVPRSASYADWKNR